jgi:hypothetical protein
LAAEAKNRKKKNKKQAIVYSFHSSNHGLALQKYQASLSMQAESEYLLQIRTGYPQGDGHILYET